MRLKFGASGIHETSVTSVIPTRLVHVPVQKTLVSAENFIIGKHILSDMNPGISCTMLKITLYLEFDLITGGCHVGGTKTILEYW